MFGTSTEKKVAREVDRIVSMKEDVDALSWGRVLEIGKLLREPADGDAVADYARELVTIAQSNLSLAIRLGIDAPLTTGPIMPSGIEVVEGGYADAALQDAPSAPGQNASRRSQRIELPVIELPSVVATVATVEPVAAEAPSAPMVEPLCDAPMAAPSSDAPGPMAESSFDASAPAVDPSCDAGCPTDAVSEPAVETVIDQAESACFEVSVPAASEIPACDPPSAACAVLSPTEEFAPIHVEDPAEFTCDVEKIEDVQRTDDSALSDDGEGDRPAHPLSSERLASFRNLYESQDGSLCVFEDEHGHLVAVDTSKLA
ncbi:hypothetical protein [Enteroscipio rubneri]|uniref:Uncharacterized protein n=1 Tax=Enteroscipio rubneri TaxID=2070686 RepID=A0A2K2UEW2_9ACTN|nr:hypothetical protein [Enteroscipio rubneri]PNV68875.1 hypothetical protein C2L71_02615 [Enteroscipio rubneri]